MGTGNFRQMNVIYKIRCEKEQRVLRGFAYCPWHVVRKELCRTVFGGPKCNKRRNQLGYDLVATDGKDGPMLKDEDLLHPNRGYVVRRVPQQTWHRC